MVEIEEQPVTAEELVDWYKTKVELGRLKSKEALLRSRIYRFFFKDPKEGTNTEPLNDGTGAVIKAVRAIDRKVDIGSLDALKLQIAAPDSNAPKLNLDELIKWTPEVSTSAYRKLTDEERMYFDQCLIIKDGSPQVSIEIPKRTKV